MSVSIGRRVIETSWATATADMNERSDGAKLAIRREVDDPRVRPSISRSFLAKTPIIVSLLDLG